MSEYPGLKPVYAVATMYISAGGRFSQVLVYDYKDVGELPPGTASSGKFIRTKLPSGAERGRRTNPRVTYERFLKDPKNYEKEIKIYWGNMQDFLNDETNFINGQQVHLEVVDCTINFRDNFRPYVQWVIEFAGTLHEGENNYENYVESEVLEYPITSTYIFEPPLKVIKVATTLKYQILKEGHLVEYQGETGQLLSPYEKLTFRK